MHSRLDQGQGWGSWSSQWRCFHCQRQRRSQQLQKTNRLQRKAIIFSSKICPIFLTKICTIPKQRSAKFLMRIFVTFLLRTDPASRKAKPACRIWLEQLQSVCVDLHQDDDWSIDNEEELVHVGLHRFKVSICLSVDFQESAIKRKLRSFPVPVQAQTDRTVEWQQQKTQWTMQLQLHPGANRAQGGSWWLGGVPGLLAQRGLPCCWEPKHKGTGLRKVPGPKTKEHPTVEELQRTKDQESIQR